jgi:hypothetical protein
VLLRRARGSVLCMIRVSPVTVCAGSVSSVLNVLCAVCGSDRNDSDATRPLSLWCLSSWLFNIMVSTHDTEESN